MQSQQHSIEARARRLAKRNGYIATKSRRYSPPNDYGEFMLLEPGMNVPVLGFRYDATPDEIIEFLSDEPDETQS
ncbi:MAG: hypothetical protein U5S82_14090 [Gammaproteobacteria bacterium]|nr:hypothetical protein [Gammaproteobacteria bacterium]